MPRELIQNPSVERAKEEINFLQQYPTYFFSHSMHYYNAIPADSRTQDTYLAMLKTIQNTVLLLTRNPNANEENLRKHLLATATLFSEALQNPTTNSPINIYVLMLRIYLHVDFYFNTNEHGLSFLQGLQQSALLNDATLNEVITSTAKLENDVSIDNKTNYLQSLRAKLLSISHHQYPAPTQYPAPPVSQPRRLYDYYSNEEQNADLNGVVHKYRRLLKSRPHVFFQKEFGAKPFRVTLNTIHGIIKRLISASLPTSLDDIGRAKAFAMQVFAEGQAFLSSRNTLNDGMSYLYNGIVQVAFALNDTAMMHHYFQQAVEYKQTDEKLLHSVFVYCNARRSHVTSTETFLINEMHRLAVEIRVGLNNDDDDAQPNAHPHRNFSPQSVSGPTFFGNYAAAAASSSQEPARTKPSSLAKAFQQP